MSELTHRMNCEALGFDAFESDCTCALKERKKIVELKAVLEEAVIGINWYRETYPEADSGTDDEFMERVKMVFVKNESQKAINHIADINPELIRRFGFNAFETKLNYVIKYAAKHRSK